MTNEQCSIDIGSCDNLQLRLEAAWEKVDLDEFSKALEAGADPCQLDERHRCIFEKVLQTHDSAEFVEKCLEYGSDPNFINNHFHKAAINFAADSRDPKIVQTLLRQHGVEINHKYSDLTPLNSLAKNLTSENTQDVTQCMKLLLDYGASPNIPDQCEMTPLHYILKNRKIDDATKRELVKLFLTQRYLNIDTYRDGEVRNILTEAYPDLLLPANTDLSSDVTFDILLTYLLREDEAKFIENKYYLQNNSQEQNAQLLIEAIKHGLHEAFDALLETGMNVNVEYNGNTVIEIAVIWGNWRAMKELLKKSDLKIPPQHKLLKIIVNKLGEPQPILRSEAQPILRSKAHPNLPSETQANLLSKPHSNQFCDYRKCISIFLESKHVNVNERDAGGLSPLHYAAKYRNHEVIQELLKHGAYIATSSVFNGLPIDGIDPEILQQHFDDCITTNGMKPGDDNFEIVMDYKNLLPYRQQQENSEQCNIRLEMKAITAIAASKEHRYLLQHPLITSFLFLKWHRLSVLFYINFLFYAFFAISIVTHTILKFRESENEAVTRLFGLFACIGIIYMIVRELTQLIMSPIKYFRSITNYMEMALIVLSVMTCREPSYARETQRVVAVFTILLVALDLCILFGSLPVLSISTHILMLREVLWSFFKILGLYSIFVVTFSLSFYILFGKPELDEKGVPKVDENGEFNKFSNPVAAFIKTIVMFTGEFDAGDMKFESLCSYLLFLLFVFLMAIVLFNLLNGLAVSDTQTIKAQAELNGSICRVDLLARYEDGNFTQLFRRIWRLFMIVCPDTIGDGKISILPNNMNKVIITLPKIYEMKDDVEMLRNNGVRNSKTIFLPLTNSNSEPQKKLLDPPVQFLPCCCSCITGKCSKMDRRTVKLAMAVIERKANASRDNIRSETTDKRLENIEQKLEKLFELHQGTRSEK